MCFQVFLTVGYCQLKAMMHLGLLGGKLCWVESLWAFSVSSCSSLTSDLTPRVPAVISDHEMTLKMGAWALDDAMSDRAQARLPPSRKHSYEKKV